jgi:hypothetical protein
MRAGYAYLLPIVTGMPAVGVGVDFDLGKVTAHNWARMIYVNNFLVQA